MIWFFQRGERRLVCEIRQARDDHGYELAWTSPDGQFHVERSDDLSALGDRRKELEQTLQFDGWKRVGRVTPPPTPPAA
jgi:hypothetical protein